jgi:hypothetical protein
VALEDHEDDRYQAQRVNMYVAVWRFELIADVQEPTTPINVEEMCAGPSTSGYLWSQ